jgi:hypothetical protein
MTAIPSIRKALERRLATLNIPTAYEGVSFTPNPNALYLRTQFDISSPDDPVIGDRYYRERLTFVVYICDVLNKGTGNAYDKAETIRALFDKGFYTQEDNVCIHVVKTPMISSSFVTQDRLVVRVFIEVLGEVWRDSLV